mmetsp:Transcript_53942/g.121172  ORF Transcript_53942/g.121172 Transcript_53942/m.121172 type:complete len:289 (-) Transcript_53942:387-1253(-)
MSSVCPVTVSVSITPVPVAISITIAFSTTFPVVHVLANLFLPHNTARCSLILGVAELFTPSQLAKKHHHQGRWLVGHPQMLLYSLQVFCLFASLCQNLSQPLSGGCIQFVLLRKCIHIFVRLWLAHKDPILHLPYLHHQQASWNSCVLYNLIQCQEISLPRLRAFVQLLVQNSSHAGVYLKTVAELLHVRINVGASTSSSSCSHRHRSIANGCVDHIYSFLHLGCWPFNSNSSRLSIRNALLFDLDRATRFLLQLSDGLATPADNSPNCCLWAFDNRLSRSRCSARHS